MGVAAVLVIVGDEILAGHTLDTNSHWLAQRLRARGVRLLRTETVPDDVAEIAATLERVLVRDGPEFAFVVGGLGPTPDDRTFEGVARALGRSLELRPEHAAWARRRAERLGLGGHPWADVDRSEAIRRMVRLPQGAHALDNPIGSALGAVLDVGPSKVVLLPGVPRELYAMFESSFEPAYLADARPQEETRELEVRCAEAQLWEALNEVQRAFPTVRVGSYPQDEHRVVLRLAGPAAEVARAHARLAELAQSHRT